MKRNIGILTFHAAHNYGSMLQAYALRHYLLGKGHNATIINLRPKAQREMYAHPLSKSMLSIKVIIKAILKPQLFWGNIRKWRLFEEFIEEELQPTEQVFENYKEVELHLNQYGFDTLISGGDQIWNQLCKDFDLSYMLPLGKQYRKIAYAPSMGKEVEVMKQDPYIENYKKYITQYDSISIREKDGADMLSQAIGKDIEVVADPVFLLEAEDYKRFIGERLIKGKYMFYYTPSHLVAREAFEGAKSYAKANGLQMVSSNAFFSQKGIQAYNACGPKEFLNLLYYADFVCGQSFHLAVFSLLFHKEFAILNGDKDPRMQELLAHCRIPQRGINLKKPIFSQMEKIDYKMIDEWIKKERYNAKSYLENQLTYKQQ